MNLLTIENLNLLCLLCLLCLVVVDIVGKIETKPKNLNSKTPSVVQKDNDI